MRRQRKILLILSAFVLILLSLWATRVNINELRATKEFRKMETVKIKIVNDENQVLELEVKVADEPDERAAGFQNISRSIIEKTLILFAFPEEEYVFFHMRNVEMSLDIAFIKADGTIIEIIRMDPDPNKLYAPNELFKYAIEAPAGFFEGKRITAGKSRLITESIPNS